jgi:CheY-like chemotaxis protein/tetratricopeptide (TPR) repeat protein
MRLDVDIAPAVSVQSFAENGDSNLASSAAREALNVGIRHAQAGDRVNARIALLRAAELDDQNENAWLWLASISEYPEELMAFLENVLDINPENERASQWMTATKTLLAKTFLQRGADAAEADQPKYAEDCFRKALEYDRNCAGAWLWLASISNDKTERVAYLECVLSIEPANKAAQTALRSIRIEEEREAFDAIKKAAINGDAVTALAALEGFNELYPDNAEAWMLRSHLVVKPADKLSALKRVLEIDSNHEAAKLSYDSLSVMFSIVEEEAPSPEPAAAEQYPASEASTDADIEEDAVLATPIAPPNEALIFEPVEKDFDIPDTIFVSGEEANEIRSFDEVDNSVEDWDRETESFDAPEMIGQEPTTIDDEDMVEAFDAPVAIPIPCDEPLSENPALADRTGFETTAQAPAEADVKTSDCPFCGTSNNETAPSCTSCRAVLSLADIECVLTNNSAETYVIRKTVDALEAERVGRSLDEAELVTLGIGHLNLRNLQYGFNCLQEACLLNPDNIILARQVNAWKIRMEEIRVAEETRGAVVKGKTILVVDDSATVRKLIAGKLEMSGHTVICSSGGEEALGQIKASVPDLVLLDIAMPGMDGYQVCRQIRGWSSTVKTPVVMISGKDGLVDKMRGRMAGAAGHITKPFGPETLMKAVEFYLAGGTDIETDPALVETESVN